MHSLVCPLSSVGIDFSDDIARETSFHQMALSSLQRVFSKLRNKLPNGYVPLYVKSDEHVKKVEHSLQRKQEDLVQKEENKRHRSLKKLGKTIQQETAKTREAKRKTEGSFVPEDEPMDFDVAVDSDEEMDRRPASGGKRPSLSRKQRDDKYGFGGKKRYKKNNTRASTDDMSSFNSKKNKQPFSSHKRRTNTTKGGNRMGKRRRVQRNRKK